jgi:hypothetical protein
MFTRQLHKEAKGQVIATRTDRQVDALRWTHLLCVALAPGSSHGARQKNLEPTFDVGVKVIED